MRTRHPFPDVELGEPEHESVPVRAEFDIPGVVVGGAEQVERGTAVPLGFMPHTAENRKTRRAAVATFQREGVNRRELWRQRKRQRRGTLDPELRAAQRKAGAK